MPLVPNPLGKPVVSETKFFQPGLQFPGTPPVLVEGDDSGWWAGIQQYGATVALAAALTAAALSTAQAIQVYSWQQDEVPQTAATIVDEDFWQNPVAPTPVVFYQQFPYSLDTQDIVPQATTIVDEDYWQPPQLTQAEEPIIFWFGDGQAITLVTLDEDYWQNPVPPAQPLWTYPQQWSFDDQVPIQAVAFRPDEDFWVNSVAPVQAAFITPQQALFDEQFPALFGQPDEDFWRNQVQPVMPILQYPQPWSFDEQIPALSAPAFHPDEDYWQNPVAPMSMVMFQIPPYGWDATEIVPQPTPGTQNYVAQSGVHNYISQDVGHGIEF